MGGKAGAAAAAKVLQGADIPDPNWFRSRGGGSYISDNV